MKLPAYSSLTAFLAHRGALRGLVAPQPQQSAALAEIEALIAQLSPPERAALDGADRGGERARHRRRAERHLTQILRSRGVLSE